MKIVFNLIPITFCGCRICGVVVGVALAGGVVDVVVAGVVPPRGCCIVSKRVDNAASCATIVAKSELSFVAAFAI